MDWRRRIGLALRVFGAMVFAMTPVGVVWGEWRGPVRSLALAATIAVALPWACLIWMVVRGHRLAPWLALGASSAVLRVGVGARALTDSVPLDELHDFADVLLVGACLGIVVADRLDSASMSWRWRVTGVGLGVMLPWLLSYLLYGVAAMVWGFWDFQPWWHAPQALVPVLPWIVGAVAVVHERVFGLALIVFGACALLLIEIPPPEHCCFGPQGHPFGYGFARWLMGLASILVTAPWLAPITRALGGGFSVRS